ncbi:MAG: MogA/MoaB family molybdenum cofactor biosynthesis protein [Deltaproteobacteria bacterium]|nr:MogA/MoaB family molybdenum cofactor biosynthesis protein [Deltaproteobacteria bacterium]
MWRVGILTCSDKGSQGERQDASAAEIKKVLPPGTFRVERYEMVPDAQETITARLVAWSDRERLDLILTTGGTGLTPRDVTPEATMAALHRKIPGMAEAMRAASLAKTPHAMLSRAVAGTRGQTLIINLPGSPKGARENLEAVLPALPHALEKIKGSEAECGAG